MQAKLFSYASYARPHLWANPDETLQGDPGALQMDIGGLETIPIWLPREGGHNFKKAVLEVATMELFSFLCNHKENNFAYTSAAIHIYIYIYTSTILKSFAILNTCMHACTHAHTHTHLQHTSTIIFYCST